MKKDSLVYIAGHSGFMGQAVVRKLKAYGYRNLILRTHKELDLTDQRRTDIFFKNSRPEYVFLLAAKVGGILANNTYPVDFIYQNLMIASNVIQSAHKYCVKKLKLSSIPKRL